MVCMCYIRGVCLCVTCLGLCVCYMYIMCSKLWKIFVWCMCGLCMMWLCVIILCYVMYVFVQSVGCVQNRCGVGVCIVSCLYLYMQCVWYM